MSRFLRVGIFLDRLDDIAEAAHMLLEATESGGDEGISKSIELARDIESMAKDLRDFIARWNCEPLIYTGQGTTDEIINLLDRLLLNAEGSSLGDFQGQ
ncbi:MAG: hypothetical protein ACOYEQ_01765 [Bacillota bacterium]